MKTHLHQMILEQAFAVRGNTDLISVIVQG